MLTCNNLTLSNGIIYLFKNLSFTLLPASLLIVRGANGSGKTNLLRMIIGRLAMDKGGSIHWNDVNIKEDICSFNLNTSYISHANALKKNLTVLENLEFWCRLSGAMELLMPAIHYFQFGCVLDMQVGHLSSGWQRKVELSKLMLSNAHLWVLDEPEANLDKESRDRLLNLIQIKVREGGVVIMASHGFSDVGFASYLDIADFNSSHLCDIIPFSRL